MSGKSSFAGTSFEATLHELRFMPSGELRVLFVVPENEADAAVKLKDGYASSLKVTVERLSHARK